jgi:hypothetical protein
MPTTIADLAQFARLTATGYRARTDQLLQEYGPESATELESDCHDRWARVRFGDGSEAIISDTTIRPNNRNAIDWTAPDAAAQAEAIRMTLDRQHGQPAPRA